MSNLKSMAKLMMVGRAYEFTRISMGFFGIRNFRYRYSWISCDVINFSGVNSKSGHSHQIQIKCLWYVFVLCLIAKTCNFISFAHSSTA